MPCGSAQAGSHTYLFQQVRMLRRVAADNRAFVSGQSDKEQDCCGRHHDGG